MYNQQMTALATAVIAVSTVIGVGSALGYYFSLHKNFNMVTLFFLELAYILAVGLFALYFRRELQK